MLLNFSILPCPDMDINFSRFPAFPITPKFPLDGGLTICELKLNELGGCEFQPSLVQICWVPNSSVIEAKQQGRRRDENKIGENGQTAYPAEGGAHFGYSRTILKDFGKTEDRGESHE